MFAAWRAHPAAIRLALVSRSVWSRPDYSLCADLEPIARACAAPFERPGRQLDDRKGAQRHSDAPGAAPPGAP